MDLKDIQCGKEYIFDPQNKYGQNELGFIKARVRYVPQDTFWNRLVKREVDVNLYAESRFAVTSGYTDNIYHVKPEDLEEMKEDANIIIRYPQDIPVFSHKDRNVFTKVAKVITSNPNIASQFDSDEIVRLLSLLTKIDFYCGLYDDEKDGVI